ncbi:MAG: N-acetylmuramoyl-L-alanine amidase [Gammaproteobacteria bacterium]
MLKNFAQFLFFLTLISGGKASYAANIEDMRVWPAPEKTRVVFDLDDAINYNIFTLDNPSRVVIDFRNSDTRKQLTTPVSINKLLRKVRSAGKENHAFRVVLDLRRKVKINSFQLDPNDKRGHRLVVDLLDLKSSKQASLIAAKNLQKKSSVVSTQTGGKKVITAKLDQTSKQQKPVLKPIVKAKKEKVILRDLIVAVDAGHGGKDPGATGKRGTKEKDVVLSIAKKLAKKINATPGMKAVLTRSKDQFLSLRKRVDIARNKNADLFISIHADAIKNHSVQGSSVYVLSEKGASSEAAKLLAEKENAVDFVGGVHFDKGDPLLNGVLLDLSQNAVMDASVNVADKVLQGLRKVGKVHKKKVQHAGFVVLKAPDVPSILIETAFISNPKEERKLLSPKEQNKLVNAIHNGVTKYFSEYAPPGTRLAAR